MKERAERQSNIELLRILATCMVIVLHYNGLGNGGFATVSDGSLNQLILVLFETISICAVNVFVITTGYFLCKTNTRDFLKPLGLVAQVVVFAVLFFSLVKLTLPGITIDHLFESLFSTNWYVYIFFALYLISPFINVMWDRLNLSGKRILLTFSIFLFSIYPTFIDIIRYWSGRQLNGSSTIGIEGSQAGYTIVNFVVLYLLGAAIRDNVSKTRERSKLITAYFICLCLIMAWAYADGMRAGKNIYDTVAWNYSNPLVIAMAVIVFMLFKDIKIKNSKMINSLAGASFTVYILHIRFLGLFKIEQFAAGNPGLMLVHLVATVICIYLICTICYFVYSAVAKPVSNVIAKKIGNYRNFTI